MYVFSRCIYRNEDRIEEEEIRRHYVVEKLAAREGIESSRDSRLVPGCLKQKVSTTLSISAAKNSVA